MLSLQNDYNLSAPGGIRDGFENWLTTHLLDAYGKDTSPLLRITFHEVESKEVCRVIAQPSGKPVFVRDDKAEHLYIRTGNSTRLLSTREAIEYCKMRWR
jgi:type I restriction enzyme, R subunit